MARHRLDDLAREQSADTRPKRITADADPGGRLEILNGREELRALARRVELIKALLSGSLCA
jgi:hypothetical protein